MRIRFLCAMLIMAFAFVIGFAQEAEAFGIGISLGRARILTPFVPSVQVFAAPQVIQQVQAVPYQQAIPVQQVKMQQVYQQQQAVQVQQVQQQAFAVQPQVFQSAAVFGAPAFLTPSFGFGTAFIGAGGFRQVGVGRAVVRNRGATVVRQRTVVRKR